MKIELHEKPVREIVEGYVNNNDEGVIGYRTNGSRPHHALARRRKNQR